MSDSRLPIADSRALAQLRDTWRTLGERDPLWAILSSPDKRGGRWALDEFFAAGENEIGAIDGYCTALGRPTTRNVALDFGCGVGRLSRALSTRYTNVIGVDIASSMIVRARELNVDRPNIRFVENAEADLRFIGDGSVDLIYSTITLHHIPAVLQRAYVAEFMRVLSPDGVAVFQIASGFSNDLTGWGYRLLPNRWLAPLRRKVHAIDVAAEMHTLDERDVDTIARHADRGILLGLDVDSAGRGFRGRLLFAG